MRRPHLLILFKPEITGSPSSSYLRLILINPCLLSFMNLYFLINPSSSRIRAISSFRVEASISTLSWPALRAFLTLVSISAIGSVTISSLFLYKTDLQMQQLPACFYHPWYLSLQSQFSEAYPAHFKFSKIGTRAFAYTASAILPH